MICTLYVNKKYMLVILTFLQYKSAVPGVVLLKSEVFFCNTVICINIARRYEILKHLVEVALATFSSLIIFNANRIHTHA
jgi:hypothetical protein